MAIVLGFAIALFKMTFEQALDHVHKIIGNDLITLRDNFKPCIQSWEDALGAVDNFDDDDDVQAEEQNEPEEAELDMDAIEEDEPIPADEDMSL